MAEFRYLYIVAVIPMELIADSYNFFSFQFLTFQWFVMHLSCPIQRDKVVKLSEKDCIIGG